MHAITTKYLGPTNTKGARVKATWRRYDGKELSVVEPYDSSLSQRDNHASVAMRLARMSMNAGNNWTCGETDTGYVFVMLGEEFSCYFNKSKYAGT